MAWYLAPALAKLRAEVDTRWPNRDHASDGTIGDEAHQGTDSDHNPNARESVDAWDMDKDGVDVNAVINAFQRHPSAHYWIWREQIADRDDGWRRRAYSGTNPHTAHVHFSIRQSAAAEQDRRSWGLLEADMDFRDGGDGEALIYRMGALVSGAISVGGGPTRGEKVQPNIKLAALETKVAALATRVEALAAAEVQRDAALRTLVEQHADGTIDAEAVVRRMGELLSSSAAQSQPA